MASPRKYFSALVLLLGAVVAGLMVQQQANAVLRDALRAKQGQQAREQAALERENQRLKSGNISPAELDRRREERAALATLAGEIENLRRRNDAAVTTPAASPGQAALRPSLREAELGAEVWTNAGRRDPLAAMETALWAAAHGDLGTLTDLLIVSEATRAQAAAVLARLPTAVRAEFNSPEQLVAMLSANAVPLGSAEVIGESSDAAGSAQLVLQLNPPDGSPRVRRLTLRADAGGWRLVVPEAEITQYFAKLQGAGGR